MLRLLRFLPRRWWSLRAWRAWRAYARWRLETYGLYDSQGRRRPNALPSLLKQFPSYYRWLGEMDRLRRKTSR